VSDRAPTALLDVSAHLGASLVEDYPSWWSAWCEENPHTFPLRLPTPVLTVPVGQVRVVGSNGDEWTVKVARVEAPGGESYEVPCAARGR